MTKQSAALSAATAEEEIARFVDEVRGDPTRRDELIALLPPAHDLYAGRGRNQVLRIRGYIFASFEALGLSDEALPYVLEELENSQSPYLVAAVATALRGATNLSSGFVRFLLSAVSNIQYHDEPVTFETYMPRWPLDDSTTAVREVVRTLGALGMHAQAALPELEGMTTQPQFSAKVRSEIRNVIAKIRSADAPQGTCCCSMPSGKTEHVAGGRSDRIDDLVLQDQAGNELPFSKAIRGKPSAVAFFYTRCGNPNKCSLTVTKLGQLQEELAEQKLAGKARVVAMTYDPGFDTPDRMSGFCGNRGFVFTDDDRAWRTRADQFDAVRRYFNLGASYVGSVVSRHQIELYILDCEGRVATSFEQLQWDVGDVARELANLA